MDVYLSQLKLSLAELYGNKQKQLHVVIGNESCDLDSAASALVLAYFMYKKAIQDGQYETVFIPVLNIPRLEYRLRTEVRYLLSEQFGNSTENNLVFIDEVPLDEVYQQGRLTLTLVDHHKLTHGELNRFSTAVRRVVDHHVDNVPEDQSLKKQCIGDDGGISRYITDTVGSCCTLVAERIFDGFLNLLDINVAKLLLGAILLDTSALRHSVKTTPRDCVAVEKLEAIFAKENCSYNRFHFYERLRTAKFDSTGMSIAEILSKDYKDIRRSSGTLGLESLNRIGMSTVILSFEALSKLTNDGDIFVNFENFRQAKGIDVLVLSCLNADPAVPEDCRKELVIYGGSDNIKDGVIAALRTIDGLTFVPAFDEGSAFRVYKQTNPGFSRKQMLPALEKLLDGKLHFNQSDNSASLSSPSKSDQLSPIENSRGQGQPSQSAEVSPIPADQETHLSSSVTEEGRLVNGNRAKRFLDSTDVARSFSVTYDDDEDDYNLGGGSTHQSDGTLGRIEEIQGQSSLASADYEFDHIDRPLDDLSSHSHSSITDDETRHYPTVNTPYALSYDGGGHSAATGSGNTQTEESGATLAGVPDLLDSRENLADMATVPIDTPDLLPDHGSPLFGTTESHFPVVNRKQSHELGDVDLLQGVNVSIKNAATDVNIDGGGESASSMRTLINYAPGVLVEQPTKTHIQDAQSINAERWKRELSQPRLFDFSSEPSPAGGRSRADTPPSTPLDDDDQLEFRRERNFARDFKGNNGDDNELGLRVPGAMTPPNTYVEHYLEDTVETPDSTTTGRRPSQQSELEPGILYLKLKRTQIGGSKATPSVADFLQESSVPGTPPNSFVGTPMVYDSSGRNTSLESVQLEPENLRRRVTELTKNLPPEDVNAEDNNGETIGMDEPDDKYRSEEITHSSDTNGPISSVGSRQIERPTLLPDVIDQFANDLSRKILPLALADAFYPAVADDGGFDNAAFSGDTTATVSPLSTAEFSDVKSDLVTVERSLPDVLSENFPTGKPQSAQMQQSEKSLFSTRLSAEFLDSGIRRPLPFDLVSCSSVASFGRESTVAHADSTEFNLDGRRVEETQKQNARVKMDFGDDSDEENDFNEQGEDRRDMEFGEEEAPTSGISMAQWEEEGYPALLDINQDDPSRIFSDKPGHFDDAFNRSIHPSDTAEVELDNQDLSCRFQKSTKKRDSEAMESGSESPNAEAADDGNRTEGETTSVKVQEAAADGLEWENDTPVLSPQKPIQQWSATSDIAEERRWRTVTINGIKHQIDMAIVEPYQRVISHGGYYGEGLNAIAVFAACYLPYRSEVDYQNIMENLFLYAVSMLDSLVAEDYVVIYFQGGSTSQQMPPFSWLRRCYHLIDRRHVSHTEIGLDRRLRKNLKGIYLVHPTLWLKTVVLMAKPFISSKFSKKVHFLQTLNDLGKLICMDQVEIPDEVLKHDYERVVTRTRADSSVLTNSTTGSNSKRLDVGNEGGDANKTSQEESQHGDVTP